MRRGLAYEVCETAKHGELLKFLQQMQQVVPPPIIVKAEFIVDLVDGEETEKEVRAMLKEQW